MRIQTYQDPTSFQTDVQPWLLAEEARNQLPLGLIGGLARGGWKGIYEAPPTLAVASDDGGGILAITMRTPPYVALISRGPGLAIRALARWYFTQQQQLPGVMGPSEEATQFAAAWANTTNARYSVRHELIAHELTRVTHPRGVSGSMRYADQTHRDMLIACYDAFDREAGISVRSPTDQVVDRHLAAKMAVFWEDAGKVCCTAFIGGETPNGKRIGAVYTQPEYRRRGYASALVAAASQAVLDQGKSRCFLFTDAANPTSNHIYRLVGYEPAGTFREYTFE